MKLSCLQENLSKGLGIVGRAVATRATLPITNNILLCTEDNRLKLAATNLEMATSHWIGAKVEAEGSITVPARLITEFVNSLPAGEKIDIALNGKTLELKCARYDAKISGVDAKDFPPIPTLDEGLSTTIETENLRQGITQVAFAAATDESRPVLTGVDVQLEGSMMTMAAADGFRLAVYKLPLSQAVAQQSEVIIPSRTLSELNRLMGDDEKTVDVMINAEKSLAIFKLSKTELVSQLVQGTFPKYNQLIPSSTTCSATVKVAEFLRACKMASIFARDGSGIVRLVMDDGKITISSKSEELGEDVGEIDATVQGEDGKIAFNGKYLIDVLSVIKEQQVTLETTSPSSPGVIRPVGSDSYTHVVMPMFVQW